VDFVTSCPPPPTGGARLLKGGACPPLNQARGACPPLVARLAIGSNDIGSNNIG